MMISKIESSNNPLLCQRTIYEILCCEICKRMIHILEHITPDIAFSESQNQLPCMFCHMTGNIN